MPRQDRPLSLNNANDFKYTGHNWFLLDRLHPDERLRTAAEKVLVEVGGYRPSGETPEGKRQTANGKNQTYEPATLELGQLCKGLVEEALREGAGLKGAKLGAAKKKAFEAMDAESSAYHKLDAEVARFTDEAVDQVNAAAPARAGNNGRPSLDELPRFLVLLPELQGDDELRDLHLALYEALGNELFPMLRVHGTNIRAHVTAVRSRIRAYEDQRAREEAPPDVAEEAGTGEQTPEAVDEEPPADPVSDFVARLTPEQRDALAVRLGGAAPMPAGPLARGPLPGAVAPAPPARGGATEPRASRAPGTPAPGPSAAALDELLESVGAVPAGSLAPLGGGDGEANDEGQVAARFKPRQGPRKRIDITKGREGRSSHSRQIPEGQGL